MTQKKWTVMIYMSGDNNLSEDMIRGIVELKARIKEIGDIQFPTGSSTKNKVGFVVQFDGEHPYVKTRFYNLTYTDLERFPDSSRPDDIDEPSGNVPTSNQGEVEKDLETFIRKAIAESPADNYALILSGHSDAFLGRTLLLDENPSGVATLQGIAKVLDNVKGLFPNGNKLDILGFDGCVMNTLEVLYQFKDVVHTAIGSQGSIPNFTWDYKEIGQKLIMETATTLTKDKVIEIVRDSIKKYNRDFAFGGRSVDFSAVELKEIETFSRQINFFAFVLLLAIRNLGTFNTTTNELSLSPALKNLFEILLQSHWNSQTFLHDQFVDIFDFCNRLNEECREAINQTGISLSDLIRENKKFQFLFWLLFIRYCCLEIKKSQTKLVNSGIFTGADYQFSGGISMFFPWSFLCLFMTTENYSKLSFFLQYPAVWLLLMFHTVLTARPEQKLKLKFMSSKDISVDILNVFSNIENEVIQPFYERIIVVVSTHIGNLTNITDAEILTLFNNSFGLLGFNLNSQTVTDFLNFNPLLDPPRSKLDPPRSKGLDNFFYYFGRTNNIFPKLNIEGTFPNGTQNDIEENI